MRNTVSGLCLALGALALTGCNFYEVHKGHLYRSAQLDGGTLAAAIDHYGIRTVINLRGESDSRWYKDEAAVATSKNVELINISMSARRLPHRADLIKLLDAFRDAPRPILIHCKGGADRTGEAAAIYKMLYMGASKSKALKMLSPKYFHIESFMPAKRYFIKHVWAGEEWARNEYDPCSEEYKYYHVKGKQCHGGQSAESLQEADDT